MGLLTVLAEALHSLTKNVVRTGLSILGIVIGIAAVIAMMAVGTGTQRAVEEEVSRLGDDWLVAWWEGRRRGAVRQKEGVRPTVVQDDVEAIREQVRGIRAMSLAYWFGGKQVISAISNYNTMIRGMEPSCFDIFRWDVLRGRTMTEEDNDQRRKVCWLGMTVVEELFGGMDPLGETIRIDRHPIEVVGVLMPKGSDADGEDLDDVIVMPVATSQTLLAGNRPPSVFFAAAERGVPIQTVKERILALMRKRHKVGPDEDDPYAMFDRSRYADARGRMTGAFKTLMLIIASMSLLVGGVGIMNIMLVSVTERTREIGVRMAIGAKSRHILTQFLCEAVVLCGLGGLLGFALGWGLAHFTTQNFMTTLTRGLTVECELSYTMVAVAIGVSGAVGVFFGFYPAWRASRLDPIDALRYE